MKMFLAVCTLAGLFCSGGAYAAFLNPGASGTITVTSACFAFDQCTVGGMGDVSDNAEPVYAGVSSPENVSSGIAGDGVVGIMHFTVAVDGNAIDIISYNMDTYSGTALGNFGTRMIDTSNATGFIDDAGNMTLNLEGRTAAAQFDPAGGERPWNIESHSTAPNVPDTGLYTVFTSGVSQAIDPAVGHLAFSLSGAALIASGVDTWMGTLVSAGNMGDAWGAFDGTPYSEIYNITVTASAVPVPAAAWLFISGLLALTGLSQRKATISRKS